MRGRHRNITWALRIGQTQHNLDNAPGLSAQVRPARVPANSNRALHVTNQKPLKKPLYALGPRLSRTGIKPPPPQNGLRQSPDSWDARSPGGSTCIRLDQPGCPTRSRLRSPSPATPEVLISEPRRTKRPRKASKAGGHLGSRKGPVRLAATDHSLSGTTGRPYRKRAWLAANQPASGPRLA